MKYGIIAVRWIAQHTHTPARLAVHFGHHDQKDKNDCEPWIYLQHRATNIDFWLRIQMAHVSSVIGPGNVNRSCYKVYTSWRARKRIYRFSCWTNPFGIWLRVRDVNTKKTRIRKLISFFRLFQSICSVRGRMPVRFVRNWLIDINQSFDSSFTKRLYNNQQTKPILNHKLLRGSMQTTMFAIRCVVAEEHAIRVCVQLLVFAFCRFSVYIMKNVRGGTREWCRILDRVACAPRLSWHDEHPFTTDGRQTTWTFHPPRRHNVGATDTLSSYSFVVSAAVRIDRRAAAFGRYFEWHPK